MSIYIGSIYIHDVSNSLVHIPNGLEKNVHANILVTGFYMSIGPNINHVIKIFSTPTHFFRFYELLVYEEYVKISPYHGNLSILLIMSIFTSHD